jgi:hypothetical protein
LDGLLSIEKEIIETMATIEIPLILNYFPTLSVSILEEHNPGIFELH